MELVIKNICIYLVIKFKIWLFRRNNKIDKLSINLIINGKIDQKNKSQGSRKKKCNDSIHFENFNKMNS